MEVSNRDIRFLAYFLYLKEFNATQATNDINQTFKSNLANVRTVQSWFQRWKNGENWLDDRERAGRPIKINDLINLLREHPSISTLELSHHLNCSQSSVKNHLHQLGFVPKLDK